MFAAAIPFRRHALSPSAIAPHEVVVRRALYWVACGLVAANLPLSVVRAVANPGAYRPGFALGALTGIAGLLARALWLSVRGRNAVNPLRALAALSWLLVAVHPWVIGEQPVAYPPLLHVLGAGMCISAVFSVRVALLVVPPLAAVVASIRAPYLGWSQAIGEACLLALSGGLAAACVDVLHKAGGTVIHAVDDVRRLEEQEWRAARRSYERERWDGLLHDKVLGALRIASRSPDGTVPEAARELAIAALAAFRGDPVPTPQSPATTWRRHAGQLGLDITVQVDGQVGDPEAGSAIVEAVCEALTNVARHSNQCRVSVIGILREHRASITVHDPGRGFIVRPELFGDGLRTSILARMRAVGGTAEITSVSGAGTAVQLTWQTPTAGPDRAARQWQSRTFAPVMFLGALVMVVNVVMGRAQWSQGRHLTLAVAGMISIAAATAVVALAAPTVRSWRMPALVLTVTAAVTAGNTAPGAAHDWRYWYLGAMTPAIAAMSFRFASGVGLFLVGLVTLTVVAVDTATGFPAWACLAGPVPVMVAAGVAGQLARRALDRAWRQVSEAGEDDARLRRAIAVDEERSQEAARRVAALADAVGPALELIVARKALTPAQAGRLSRLEAATRDHLGAPDLLDGPLVTALSASRARGVRVDVVSTRVEARDGRSDGGAASGSGGVDGYRNLLAELLALAPPQTRVRALWRPDAGLAESTLSAVGPGLNQVARALRRLAATMPAARSRITCDEDSLLVEFAAQSPVRQVLDVRDGVQVP